MHSPTTELTLACRLGWIQVVAILLTLTLLPIKEYPLPDTVNGPPAKQNDNGNGDREAEEERGVDEEAQTSASEEEVGGQNGSSGQREQ